MAALIKQRKPAAGYQSRPWLKLIPRAKVTENNTLRLYMPDGPVTLPDTMVKALPVHMSLDEAATVVVAVTDPAGDMASLALLDADEDMLLDGIDARWRALWWRVARVERADDGWQVTIEDRVAAYLRSHKRAVTASRASVTRAQFVHRLALGVKAGGGIPCYIPELKVKQGIYEPERPAGTAGKVSGAGSWGSAGPKVRVKGVKASAAQLTAIDADLAEAAKLGATKRVLTAVVMCITQESNAGDPHYRGQGDAAGPDSRGDFQQRAPWGPLKDRMDHAKSTKMFLEGGRGGQPGWKQKHGSLKASGGSLGDMITAVQVSVGGYSQWESEAKKTVGLWLDRNPDALGGGPGSDDGEDDATYYRGQYAFRTSAEAGAPQNWWDATGALADEVKWHRWAVSNTLGYATDAEMIRGNPVVWISRSRQEVLDLSYTWDYRREASELKVKLALKDPFQLLPGMVAMVDDEAPVVGRWLVDVVDVDPLAGNIADVTLRRPGAKKLEPAPVLKTRKDSDGVKIGAKNSYGTPDDGGDAGDGTGAKAVYNAAVRISRQNLAYSWGGGHEKAGTPSKHPSSSTGGPIVLGYDCSGYVGACLAAAGLGIKPGDSVGDSGWFAKSWGEPGEGEKFTVWANATHAWLEFHGLGKYTRAGTDRVGPEPSGPHVGIAEHTAAYKSTFTPRRWPGL